MNDFNAVPAVNSSTAKLVYLLYLGGLVFGHFGDKIGRKSMLLLTLMLMGIPTIQGEPVKFKGLCDQQRAPPGTVRSRPHRNWQRIRFHRSR